MTIHEAKHMTTQEILAKHGDLLVVSESDAYLCRRENLPTPSGSVAFVADVRAMLGLFAKHAGSPGEQYFPTKSAAKAAGVAQHMILGWVTDGILRPVRRGRRGPTGETLFSWQGCFHGAVAGSFHRAGATKQTIRKVINLLRDGPQPSPMDSTTSTETVTHDR
jgi:DNA-binding transcriptional MerR regulator